MNPVVARGDIFASSPTKFKIGEFSGKRNAKEIIHTDRTLPVRAEPQVEIGGWEPQMDSAPVEEHTTT